MVFVLLLYVLYCAFRCFKNCPFGDTIHSPRTYNYNDTVNLVIFHSNECGHRRQFRRGVHPNKPQFQNNNINPISFVSHIRYENKRVCVCVLFLTDTCRTEANVPIKLGKVSRKKWFFELFWREREILKINQNHVNNCLVVGTSISCNRISLGNSRSRAFRMFD